jgi:hypothetical protein
MFESIPNEFIEKIKYMNNELLNTQCKSINYAISLCEDEQFLSNYENSLDSCVEKRKQIFREWEEHYNLNTFI